MASQARHIVVLAQSPAQIDRAEPSTLQKQDEKKDDLVIPPNSDYGHHLTFWVVGAVIGLGQLLLGEDQLSWRRVLGRMFVSGGLGASASILLVIWPDISDQALLGGAAAFASLGTSGIEKVIDGWRKK